MNSHEAKIIIIESGDRIVPKMEASFATRIHKILIEKDVIIITRTKIISRTSDTATLSSGEVLKTKTVIWTGGIRIDELARESGMKIGQSGRIIVNEFLRAENHPFIYAIGDNALAVNPITGKAVPTAAQFALQQGRLARLSQFALKNGHF